MITVKRPARLFSFGDFAKTSPREPLPGDRVDAMFIELIDAIQTTQDALAEIRRDDGSLKRIVKREHLDPGLLDEVNDRLRDAAMPVQAAISAGIVQTQDSERSAALYAKDAEAAVRVQQQLISAWNDIRFTTERASEYVQRVSAVIDIEATDAENWAQYSKAQADNAIAAKDEALQWAEYLAGPVVNAAEAPAYIADTPFPNGLYYQPVRGGLAGLWSAKWWALYAQNLVGTAGFYYLGAWPTPPLPGEQNPDTGQTVPNPLATGSIYFDTTSQKLFVWDGDSWEQPVTLSATFRAQYAYQATANQTVFSGADLNGAQPQVGASPSDVFVNGVRLIPNADYQIDAAANTLTLTDPVAVNSMVQWDLLLSSADLAPGAVNAFKMHALAPDGVLQDFTLQYTAGGATVDASVGDGVQLMVSLDGAIQEPGADYTALGSSIHFIAPPDATAHLWIVWYQPGVPAP